MNKTIDSFIKPRTSQNTERCIIEESSKKTIDSFIKPRTSQNIKNCTIE